MTFFDCTADLVRQLNGNGHKGMLQIDAPPVENFWLRHWHGGLVAQGSRAPRCSRVQTEQEELSLHREAEKGTTFLLWINLLIRNVI